MISPSIVIMACSMHDVVVVCARNKVIYTIEIMACSMHDIFLVCALDTVIYAVTLKCHSKLYNRTKLIGHINNNNSYLFQKKMGLLRGTEMLLVLLTAFLSVEAANIPVPEGKSVEDIFSTLNTFKTNIIGLISNGFTAPKKINPPAPQENYHHVVPPPSPPYHQYPPPHFPHIPNDLSQAFYVTNSPNLGHDSHPQFDSHGPHPNPQPFPIMEI